MWREISYIIAITILYLQHKSKILCYVVWNRNEICFKFCFVMNIETERVKKKL